MQQGYGFAGEGDWKTAALLRIMKVMSTGLQGGTSFMEDYTYHFEKVMTRCSAPICWKSARRSPQKRNRSSTFSISVLVVRTILPA